MTRFSFFGIVRLMKKIPPFVIFVPNEDLYKMVKGFLESKGFSLEDYDSTKKNLGNFFPGEHGAAPKNFGLIYYNYCTLYWSQGRKFKANELEEFVDFVNSNLKDLDAG